PQYIVPLAESSIDMIWAPAYGSNKKNATDIRLAVDALELVFTRPEIGTFILLSGDSDFSSLVLKLKEYGKYVIGVGIRESSSDLLIQNCDEYYSYNELAGLTKESDVTHERHDPWDLVIEAVKQMTAHSDVMRSDRLKQVMQEIDPTFNEKDLGFSRFSKFVVEAAHKGLIALNKLDNGQYEIGLGPGVPGAAAQPAGLATFDRPRERERGEGRGRGRRGRGGRDEREAREEPVATDEPPALPPAREERRRAFSLAGASRRTTGRARRRDRRRRGARSPDARVLGAAIHAAGERARRRCALTQRPVPSGFARATGGAPRHPEDRGRRDGPEFQASDRAGAAQAPPPTGPGGTGAVRRRQRPSRRCRARSTQPRRPRWPRRQWQGHRA